MKIIDVSRCEIGTQIVLSLQADPINAGHYEAGCKEWSRLCAMAKQIEAREYVKGVFDCADVQDLGYETQIQLSWRMSHETC